MAGIGFVLRKLSRQDNLTGNIRAFLSAMLVATGPWLITVTTIGVVFMLARGESYAASRAYDIFTRVIIYNFSFSLVFLGPLSLICTRYLSDQIFMKDVSKVIGMLFGALILLIVVQLPVALLLYVVVAKLSALVAILAIINFMLISLMWFITPFLTALKSVKTVSFAILVGISLAIFLTWYAALNHGIEMMLVGFNIGLVCIVAAILSQIFIEYPCQIKAPFDILKHFNKLKVLALSGLLSSLAIWVDKWIMWFSPESLALHREGGFIFYPNYDSAMFLAYLAVIPALALFLYKVETDFFEKLDQFTKGISKHDTLKMIKEKHLAVVNSFVGSSLQLFLFQGVICLFLLMIAPQIFAWLQINYLQISIFRYGLIGSLFQVQALFLTIILSYFDARWALLKCMGVFLVTNALFTLATFGLGYEYYGVGYALSCILTFAYAAWLTVRHLNDLIYHSFVTANNLP